ncbi:hypothetical protein FOCC_FOCC005455 [Frankliniella occidentalis]|nr:hypothetical protein FOCC_FOCC005455 [Frankliniella occidentalis]
MSVEWLTPSSASEAAVFFADGSSLSTGSSVVDAVGGADAAPRKSDQVRCEACGRLYNHRASYYCHRKYECGKEPQFQCPYCPQRSKRIGNLKKHVLTVHPGQPPWKPEPDWRYRARPRHVFK